MAPPSKSTTAWGVSSSLALILILTIASATAISALLQHSSSSSSQQQPSSASSSNANNNNNDAENQSTTCRQSDPKFPNMRLHHFASIGSTQDEARRIVTDDNHQLLLLDDEGVNMVCVTATEQTNGRGTSGRAWMGARGNTFVTIGIPQQRWMQYKHLPLTLLPLEVGILVAERVQALLDQYCNGETFKPKVTLKWPNDVLVNQDKIAGILIESSTTGWFLIGIGVNLAYAPPVPTQGPNHGRTSTCLDNHCSLSNVNWEDVAHQVGVDLAQHLDTFLNNPPMTSNAIVDKWKQWADFSMELVMRDTPQRERVKVVDMLPDGQIRVVNLEDGSSRVIVADYFI